MTEPESDLRWRVRGQCGPTIQVLYAIDKCENYSEVEVWLLVLLNGLPGVLLWSIHWPRQDVWLAEPCYGKEQIHHLSLQMLLLSFL